MPTFIIGPKQLDIYETLLRISDKIYDLYMSLYNLEVSNKKDSSEYSSKLKSLIELLNEERKVYADKLLTTEMCQAFTALLLQTRTPDNFPSNMESIVTMNYDSIIPRRILNRLSTILTNDTDAMKKMIPNGLKDILASLGVADVERLLKHGIDSSIKFQKSLDIDTLSIFLDCIEEQKKALSLHKFGNNFGLVKYMTAYINADIEANMIQSSFEVAENTYIGSRFVADILKIANEAFIPLKNIYSIELADSQINGILNITDFHYIEDDKNCEAVLRQCLLRATLFLMSDENADSILSDVDGYSSSNTSISKISVAIIKDAFTKIKHDKEKHKVYSLYENFTFY